MKDYKKILEGVVNIINTTEKSDIGFANICTYIGEKCPELKESEDERIMGAFRDFAEPSDEQMKALSCINVTGCISYVGQGQELINLYNDLKKLKVL